MIRVLTTAAALVFCAAPAWAIGCVVEPSPVNCLGAQMTMPMYQPAPVYVPSYRQPVYQPYYAAPHNDAASQLNHILGAQERARYNGW